MTHAEAPSYTTKSLGSLEANTVHEQIMYGDTSTTGGLRRIKFSTDGYCSST